MIEIDKINNVIDENTVIVCSFCTELLTSIKNIKKIIKNGNEEYLISIYKTSPKIIIFDFPKFSKKKKKLKQELSIHNSIICGECCNEIGKKIISTSDEEDSIKNQLILFDSNILFHNFEKNVYKTFKSYFNEENHMNCIEINKINFMKIKHNVKDEENLSENLENVDKDFVSKNKNKINETIGVKKFQELNCLLKNFSIIIEGFNDRIDNCNTTMNQISNIVEILENNVEDWKNDKK